MTRIVVVGPLWGHEDGLRRRLTEDGYALDTVREHVRLLSELSDWLDGHELGTADLSEVTVRQFVADRRGAGLRTGRSARALAPWQEVLLAEYSAFLEGERAVSAGTLKHYRRCARVFLDWASDTEDCVWRLEAGQVTAYVMDWARRREGGAASFPDRADLGAALRFAAAAPDGDSVACVTGALLGAVHGAEALPVDLVSRHELAWVLDTLARDLVAQLTDPPPAATGTPWAGTRTGWTATPAGDPPAPILRTSTASPTPHSSISVTGAAKVYVKFPKGSANKAIPLSFL